MERVLRHAENTDSQSNKTVTSCCGTQQIQIRLASCYRFKETARVHDHCWPVVDAYRDACLLILISVGSFLLDLTPQSSLPRQAVCD
jgi:hypothetical protein